MFQTEPLSGDTPKSRHRTMDGSVKKGTRIQEYQTPPPLVTIGGNRTTHGPTPPTLSRSTPSPPSQLDPPLLHTLAPPQRQMDVPPALDLAPTPSVCIGAARFINDLLRQSGAIAPQVAATQKSPEKEEGDETPMGRLSSEYAQRHQSGGSCRVSLSFDHGVSMAQRLMQMAQRVNSKAQAMKRHSPPPLLQMVRGRVEGSQDSLGIPQYTMESSHANTGGLHDNMQRSHDNMRRSHDSMEGPHDNNRRSHDNMEKFQDNIGRSNDHIGIPRDNMGRSQDNMVGSHDNIGRCQDNLGRAHDNVGRPYDNIERSQDSLWKSHDYMGRSHDTMERVQGNRGISQRRSLDSMRMAEHQNASISYRPGEHSNANQSFLQERHPPFSPRMPNHFDSINTQGSAPRTPHPFDSMNTTSCAPRTPQPADRSESRASSDPGVHSPRTVRPYPIRVYSTPLHETNTPPSPGYHGQFLLDGQNNTHYNHPNSRQLCYQQQEQFQQHPNVEGRVQLQRGYGPVTHMKGEQVEQYAFYKGCNSSYLTSQKREVPCHPFLPVHTNHQQDQSLSNGYYQVSCRKRSHSSLEDEASLPLGPGHGQPVPSPMSYEPTTPHFQNGYSTADLHPNIYMMPGQDPAVPHSHAQSPHPNPDNSHSLCTSSPSHAQHHHYRAGHEVPKVEAIEKLNASPRGSSAPLPSSYVQLPDSNTPIKKRRRSPLNSDSEQIIVYRTEDPRIVLDGVVNHANNKDNRGDPHADSHQPLLNRGHDNSRVLASDPYFNQTQSIYRHQLPPDSMVGQQCPIERPQPQSQQRILTSPMPQRLNIYPQEEVPLEEPSHISPENGQCQVIVHQSDQWQSHWEPPILDEPLCLTQTETEECHALDLSCKAK